MVFVDTHTHNADEALIIDEEGVIERALQAGVQIMLQADVDSTERPAMHAIVDRHPGVLRPMAGLYPGSVEGNWQDEVAEVEKVLDSRTDIVAMGEIGLDYHYGADTAGLQREAFRVQLEMAAARDLPVNIHLREATEDFFSIIADCAHLGLRGNLHAFSGSAETFRRANKYGDWSVGIGGVLTFKNAGIARDLVDIPLDNILLETDSPYLAPVPLRGTRNESANIPVIAAKVAALKGVSIEEVAEKTTQNAFRLFRL